MKTTLVDHDGTGGTSAVQNPPSYANAVGQDVSKSWCFFFLELCVSPVAEYSCLLVLQARVAHFFFSLNSALGGKK